MLQTSGFMKGRINNVGHGVKLNVSKNNQRFSASVQVKSTMHSSGVHTSAREAYRALYQEMIFAEVDGRNSALRALSKIY